MYLKQDTLSLILTFKCILLFFKSCPRVYLIFYFSVSSIIFVKEILGLLKNFEKKKYFD